uniref:Uncharacterized protein n=1 Tax=Ditylenchus dipsaci TaxID=166011 RepID=A0A915CS81_9BILA
MDLEVSEAARRIIAEMKNKFRERFLSSQTLDATIDYLRQHAYYEKEVERTGTFEIPANFSAVEIRQLDYSLSDALVVDVLH